MHSKHDSHKLQPISDENVVTPTEDIRVLALIVKRKFKHKTQYFQ